MEKMRKFFSYCLVAGVFVAGIICIMAPFAGFDKLSEDDYIHYAEIATQYFENGTINAENISATKVSNATITVVATDRPFSPSLTFVFEKDKCKVENGVNLYFLQIIPFIFLVCIGAMLIIGVILYPIMSYLPQNKEGG